MTRAETRGPNGGAMVQDFHDETLWFELCPMCNGDGLVEDYDSWAEDPGRINCPACESNGVTGHQVQKESTV